MGLPVGLPEMCPAQRQEELRHVTPLVPVHQTGAVDRVQQETRAQAIPEISVVGTLTSTNF